MAESSTHLDESAQKELLTLARFTLEGYLSGGSIPEYHPKCDSLRVQSGAFVTLHAGEHLRGCIGQIVADEQLYRTIQQCAISAAVQDFRFSPVAADELPSLTIEISVLTPMRRLRNVAELEVGRHGLYITRGGQRGLLLPQVALQYRWDRQTFLVHACRKAGLRDDAWRQAGTVIYLFEAQVFGE